MKKALTLFCCFFLNSFSLIHSQTNIDFEQTPAGAYSSATAVSGWTLSSRTVTNCNSTATWTPGSAEFSIVSTPVLNNTIIGPLSNSPLGGSVIAVLNTTTANSSATRIRNTFSVTSSNTLFQLAYAGVWQNGNHMCCEDAGFKLTLYDASGNALSCAGHTVTGASCPGFAGTTSVTTTESWSNWQVKYIDLTPYTGSVITVEVIAFDCTDGNHYGQVFLDMRTGGSIICANCNGLPGTAVTPSTVDFCAGSSVARLRAPYGYSGYSWTGPPGNPISANQASLTEIIITNPIPGNVYTVNLSNAGGCIFTHTLVIAYSVVNITAVGSGSSCNGGSSGSATVIANGSGSGYNYNWMNSSANSVGTGSVVNNLAAGNYTVNVTAVGSPGCGTDSRTISIGTAPSSLIYLLRPYCGNEAYFSTNGGSNVQWYNGTSSLSPAQGGTGSTFTLTNPAGNLISVVYTSINGCRDSIRYTLVSTPPGSLILTANPLTCQNTFNGSAVFNLIPAPGSTQGLNSYSVFSTGTTSAYNSSLAPTASNTFTAANLFAGGTYSIQAFDGLCKYTKSFSVTAFVFNYNVSASSSTLCPGYSAVAAVTFTSPPSNSQYSYSWTPSTFVTGPNAPNAIFSPSTAPGSVTTLVYSVVVTPTVVNCPLTKTISITAVNPVTPTIQLIPDLCLNSPAFTLSVNPSGGIFSANSAISPGGVLLPMTASIGVNFFTYSHSVGTCFATSTGTFTVNRLPAFTISGNRIICKGQSTTLLASGTDAYLWSNTSTTPFITFGPLVTTSYSVEGTDLTTHCSAIQEITVTVIPQPTVSVSGNTLICAGESATLTVSGAASYNWNTGSTSTVMVIGPAATTSYSVTGITSLASCSDTQSITVQVANCNLTGIDQWSSNESVKIYPNPATKKLFIEVQKEVKMVLRDDLGKIVLEQSFEKGNHLIDLNNYSAGIYFMTLTGDNYSRTVKVIKTE